MRRPRPFACVALGIRGAAVFLLAALLIGASTKLPDPLAAGSQGTELPILMYHSVLRDEKRSGKYIVSPHTIEEDLAYLSGHGYTAILPAELAGIVNRGGRLSLSSFPLTTVISIISPMSCRCSSNTI